MNKLVKFPLNSLKRPAVGKGVSWKTYTGPVNTPMVGILVPSGVFIVDLDTYKGITHEAVEREVGCALPWDSAQLQRTLHGGVHYAFNCGNAKLTQGQDIAGVIGFDARAAGDGYIATGQGYTELTPFGLEYALSNPDLLPALPQVAIDYFSRSHSSNKVILATATPAGVPDFAQFLASQPKGFTIEQMVGVLAQLPDSAAAGPEWVKVGMAIWHETQGSEDGWIIFDEFSQRALDKYDERMNRVRWDSFGNKSGRVPITFASVIDMLPKVEKSLPVLPSDTVEDLLSRAAQVTNYEEYVEFRTEVAGDDSIPQDVRYMLAQRLHVGYGKVNGLPIATVRADLTPARGELVLAEDGGLFKDWVYVEALSCYYDLSRGVDVSPSALKVRFDGHEVIKESGLDAVKFASHSHVPIVRDIMFHPGQTQIFNYQGLNMVNTFKSLNLDIPDTLSAEQQLGVDSFERHLAFLLPNEKDRVIVRDWMAYVVQNPGKRVSWAIVVKGVHGDGKTYLSRVMEAVTGSVNQVAGSSFGGQFNSWAQGALVVAVEEIRVSGDKKYEALDRMKPLISNSSIPIEEKGRDVRTIPNFSSYMLFTNHADALPIAESERRYCVFETPFTSRAQLYQAFGGADQSAAYYDALFDSLNAHPEALAYHLLNHVVSPSFKPSSQAPETSARTRMIEATVSSAQEALESAIETHACDIVSAALLDVTYLNNKCDMVLTPSGKPTIVLPKGRALGNTLRDMGYVQIEGRKARAGARVSYIWYNPFNHNSASAVEAVKNSTTF